MFARYVIRLVRYAAFYDAAALTGLIPHELPLDVDAKARSPRT
jgi:hypothetical protein